MTEEWKTYLHEETSKEYSISNLGNVKSVDSNGKEYLHSSYKNNGYRCIPYRKPSGKNGLIYVHKIMLQIWVENPKSYRRYKFNDDEPSNCTAANLSWISDEEAKAIKRSKTKPFHIYNKYPTNAKLSTARVAILKKRILENEKNKKTKWTTMAKQFGIDYRHLYLIRKGKLWKRVAPAD